MRRPRPFRFSVQAGAATTRGEWVASARRAEELGYAALFTADHYYGPGEIAAASGKSPVELAAVPAIMAAADATSTFGVGCRFFCGDYHRPVLLAKQLATIDVLCEGRLDVGLGADYVSTDYSCLII